MSAVGLEYVKTLKGLTYYDFKQIHSVPICRQISSNCKRKTTSDRFMAAVYIITTFALSWFLSFKFLSFISTQILTIYFLSSSAWKKAQHHENMHEQAELRITELLKGEQTPSKVEYLEP